MDNRSNTIAGWVLFAGIIALGATIVTGQYFHGHSEGDTCEAGAGYCPEYVANADDDTGGGDEVVQPIAFYLASANAADGEAAFAQCVSCHTIAPGGANGIGPNLYGIMGKDIAGGNFGYSGALQDVPGAWGWDNMSDWLISPKRFASGTAMNFAGLKNDERRAALLLYLNQQSASPLPVPPPPPPVEEETEGAEEGPTEEVGVLEEGTGDDVEAADGGVDVPESE